MAGIWRKRKAWLMKEHETMRGGTYMEATMTVIVQWQRDVRMGWRGVNAGWVCRESPSF